MSAGASNRHAPTAVGRPIARVDGLAKVDGSARYVDDLDVPGCWHGRTVRSDVAHGVLEAIRLEPPADAADVVLVTARDVPGRNVVALIEDDQPALVPVGGTIRHVDEPVALVAAPTRAAAAEAARRVRLDVRPLPPVLTIEDSLAGGTLVHGDDNVFTRLRIVRGDDVEQALARCDHVLDHVYRTGAQEQMYIEPQGMLARWDGGVCHVTGSMQCPYYVHRALTTLLGLDDGRVVVTQSVTGGGFGGKEEYPSMIAAHAALLARAAGRPVKIVYDRREDIAATTKRHPSRVHHRLGFMDDGTLVAADIDVVIDGGAYVTLSPVVLSRAILHAPGPYRIPHVRVRGRAVATNAPPHGAFRGFGAPQTTFATERQITRAARRLGRDPLALRRHARLRAGDETATGQVLEASVGSTEVLDAIAAVADHPTPRGPRLGTLPSPVRRGRGVSFCYHGAGFTGSGEHRLAARATVATLPDGRFEVLTSSTDIGQGTITIFVQIAADALGVPTGAVHLGDPTTARVPDSGPTVASRTCMVVGHVVEQAARRLRERLERWARDEGLDAGELGTVAARHGERAGEAAETVTYRPPPGISWDDETYTGAAYPTYGWACCLVDVAVDEDTHEVTVERCVHAVDVGRAIHPRLVQGQIEGGTLQALGWALLESVAYGEGRVLNASMTDCIIPTSFDAPELETILVEVPYPHGPHGAKGVGEIPMDGPAAAVCNAIEDALGVPVDEVPALPEVVARAGAGAASPAAGGTRP